MRPIMSPILPRAEQQVIFGLSHGRRGPLKRICCAYTCDSWTGKPIGNEMFLK
jgi:hypothetical protein